MPRVSYVAGIDFSSEAIDVVLIPEDEGDWLSGGKSAVWHHFELAGNDAFDRTRVIGEAMPSRDSTWWDDVYAVGIEHPAGKYGTGAMMRVQGAVLSMIPGALMVKPWPPGSWRKAIGLKGNATKGEISSHVKFVPNSFSPVEDRWDWPQDACDAFCIALATLRAIRVEAAA